MPKHSRGAFDRRRPGQPDGADDVINRYGTYEIQDTCGMANDFPMIAQGLPREGGRPEKKLVRREGNSKSSQPEQ